MKTPLCLGLHVPYYPTPQGSSAWKFHTASCHHAALSVRLHPCRISQLKMCSLHLAISQLALLQSCWLCTAAILACPTLQDMVDPSKPLQATAEATTRLTTACLTTHHNHTATLHRQKQFVVHITTGLPLVCAAHRLLCKRVSRATRPQHDCWWPRITSSRCWVSGMVCKEHTCKKCDSVAAPQSHIRARQGLPTAAYSTDRA